MIAKLMAVVVTVLLLFGVAQVADVQLADDAAELAPDDAVVPTTPRIVAIDRQVVAHAMPAVSDPVMFAFVPTTFRPPRG